MAVTTTSPVFGWLLPTEGGSSGTWDTLINEAVNGTAAGAETIDGIDIVVSNIKTTADAALSRAGGDMTGEIDVLTERYVSVVTSTSGTITLDLDVGNFFSIVPSGDFTVAFSNVPAASDAVFIQIMITGGASHTPTWDSSIDWPAATAPTLTAGVDLITGFTIDGGTIWHLAAAMLNSS